MLRDIVASPQDVELKRRLYPIARAELIAHAAAEEAVLYPILDAFKETAELAGHSREDHRELDLFIRILDRTAMESPSWDYFCERLEEALSHHHWEEEEIFCSKIAAFIDDPLSRHLLHRFCLKKKAHGSAQPPATSPMPPPRGDAPSSSASSSDSWPLPTTR